MKWQGRRGSDNIEDRRRRSGGGAVTGGVGLIASQLARALGVTMIGTVSTDEKAEIARANGCAHVIVTAREDQ